MSLFPQLAINLRFPKRIERMKRNSVAGLCRTDESIRPLIPPQPAERFGRRPTNLRGRILQERIGKPRKTSGELAFVLAVRRRTQSLPAWRELLKKEHAWARPYAVSALAAFGDRESSPAIRRLLQSRKSGIREAAVRALEVLDGKRVIPAARRMIHDRSPRVRYAAIETLGRLGAGEAVPDLLALLKDRDADVRCHAARALARLGRSDGVRILIEEAARGDYFLDGGAFMTELNRLRRPDAWKRLEEARLDENLWGPAATTAARLANKVGMRFEASPGTHFEGERGKEFEGFPSYSGRSSILEAFQGSLWLGEDLILEADRIRIVTTREAVRFWMEWRGDRK